MENIREISNLDSINTFIYVLKMLFIAIVTYYVFCRILNIKKFWNFKLVLVILFAIPITIMHSLMRYDYVSSIIFFIVSLNILYSIITSNKFGYSLIVTITALSINYVFYFISIFIAFVPNVIFGVQDDLISFIFISSCHCVFIYLLFKIKKFKYGFDFLKSNLENEYFDILILNISVIILFSIIILNNYNFLISVSLCFSFIVFAIIMFITIQKSLTLYYKHNLLVKDLNDTKLELEEKNKEIEKLEKENLEFSKTSHSIAHKQRALEYKLNQLMMNNEIFDELSLSDRIKNVSSELFDNKIVPSLPKTDIDEIDDMLEFMQAECNNNNIEFELSLSGNIHHMVNTFVPKEDLSILLADHIKNSIIAINNSDNINKSILVKLGLIDDYYSLYVYDSGIEFEPDTLSNLGKKPITTHKDTGGTGFGFMNTFDTLKKYNASLIINELNPPCKDNYTKSIIIKFDNKNEFIVNSYRK